MGKLANYIVVFLLFQTTEGRKQEKGGSTSLDERLRENEDDPKTWTEEEYRLTVTPVVSVLAALFIIVVTIKAIPRFFDHTEDRWLNEEPSMRLLRDELKSDSDKLTAADRSAIETFKEAGNKYHDIVKSLWADKDASAIDVTNRQMLNEDSEFYEQQNSLLTMLTHSHPSNRT